MKLFKKLMSAMLASVLAVGMLAGCSGGSVNGDKTKAFNELKAALAQQGLRISNAQDTAEASSLSKFSGPDAVWTSDLEETNYSLNKRYTDTMIAGLVDYRCNSVGIAVKDGKMSIVYLRITEIPAENS